MLVSGEKLLCSVHFPAACTRTMDFSGAFFIFSEKGKYLWEMLPKKALQVGGNVGNSILRHLRWPSKAPSIMEGHARHQPMHSCHMWHKTRHTGKTSPSGATGGTGRIPLGMLNGTRYLCLDTCTTVPVTGYLNVSRFFWLHWLALHSRDRIWRTYIHLYISN